MAKTKSRKLNTYRISNDPEELALVAKKFNTRSSVIMSFKEKLKTTSRQKIYAELIKAGYTPVKLTKKEKAAVIAKVKGK